MNAHELIGCPFADYGATPAGFDCWGLVEYVRRECFARDTPIVAPMNHAPRAVHAAILETLAHGHWRELPPPGELAAVVGMARTSRGPLHHVGVIIDGGVLHAFTGNRDSGSVILTPFERLAVFFHQVQVWQWPN